MALPEDLPTLQLEPSQSMRSLFRRTVMAAFGRPAVDGQITVSIDPYGFSVNQETIEPGPTPGKPVALDRWITLTTDGELSGHQEAEPLSQRLAREIRSSDHKPNQFEQDIEAFRALGYSRQEATQMAIGIFFARPGIAEACELLVDHLDKLDEEAAHGVNEVDAFELAETIQRVRDNFGLPPS